MPRAEVLKPNAHPIVPIGLMNCEIFCTSIGFFNQWAIRKSRAHQAWEEPSFVALWQRRL